MIEILYVIAKVIFFIGAVLLLILGDPTIKHVGTAVIAAIVGAFTGSQITSKMNE